MTRLQQLRSLLWALALPLALLLLIAPCQLRALAQSAASDSASSALLPGDSSSDAPPRALLFRPAFDAAVDGSPPGSPSPAPFPSSGTRPLDSPFPLHVSLDALGSARFSFGVLPSLPVGATLVGFDWRRNGTVGTLRPAQQSSTSAAAAAASYGVEWGQSLPSWLRFIAPSAGGTATTSAGAFDTQSPSLPPSSSSSSSSPSPSNTFTLQVVAPQSGDRSAVYASPAPVVLHLVALVQYQYPPPLRPDDEGAEGEGGGGDAAASAVDASDSSSSSPSSPSSSSSSGAPSTPLVLIAEVQYASLLVSLTILAPFEQRVAEMAPFYSLVPSPNMLDPRNRLANARQSQSGGSSNGGGGKTQGLGSKKFSWRDEVVYTCAGAREHECALCTPEAPPSSSSSSPASSGSVAPFPLLCSFPAGSFVNVASGALVVRAPLALQGMLQINAGATLEFDHDLPPAPASVPSPSAAGVADRLVNGVSVVDCRDRLGRASPLVNEGLIVVRRGHVVLYSQMRGKGAIHVHAGGSIEFVSLKAHGSGTGSSSSLGGGGGGGTSPASVSVSASSPAIPGVIYFNHTGILPDKSLSNLAGVSASAAAGGRHLLQLREEEGKGADAPALTTTLPRDEAALLRDREEEKATSISSSSIGTTGADSSADSHHPSIAAVSGPFEPGADSTVPALNGPEPQLVPPSSAAPVTATLTGAAASDADADGHWEPVLPPSITAAAVAAAAEDTAADVDASRVAVSMEPLVPADSVSSFEIAAANTTATATTTTAPGATGAANANASSSSSSSDVAAAVQPSSPSSLPPWSDPAETTQPSSSFSPTSPTQAPSAASPAASVPPPSLAPSSTGHASPAASNATSQAPSNSTSPLSASSNTTAAAGPSSPSPPPSASSSPSASSPSTGAVPFVPHPSAILVCFGGGVLFSHGRFAFLAPFQSALPLAAASRLPSSSSSSGGAGSAGSNPRNQAYSRIVLARHAEVSFFEPAAAAANATSNTTGAVGWWGGGGSGGSGGGGSGGGAHPPNSTLPAPAAPLPPSHLLSGTHLCNLGLLRVSSSARLNISSLLFFRSAGMLRVEGTALLLMDLSDDETLNVIEGVDGRSGTAPDETERARLGEAAAFLASAATADPDADASAEQPFALEDEQQQQSSESSDVDVAVAEADALLQADSAPGGPSASLSSLQSALASLSSSSSSSPGSSPAASALASRPSRGGVGLLLSDGATLSVRGGRLHFLCGFIARDQSHLFIRRGVRWTIEVEPTVGPAWGVPRDDTANAALFAPSATAAASPSSVALQSSSSSSPFATPSASHLHLSGVEFSLDGVLLLRRGHLVLQTPLLQIEGHGQLQARGRGASILMDNRRTNGAIALAQAQILAGAFDHDDDELLPEESVLEQNPDADTDPDAAAYTLKPKEKEEEATEAAKDQPSKPAPALPQLRENLVAPCVTTLRCQSLQLTEGARLQVAPLTVLHLLPRALAHVSSTALEGGALLLDSGAEYRGRVLVANLSEAASFDQGGGGGAISLPAIHIGNDSVVSMQAITEPIVLGPDAAAAVAADSPAAAVTQLSPPLCVLATGNLTGNGVFQCDGGGGGGGDNATDPGQPAAQLDPATAAAAAAAGFGTLLLDSVLVYPSFRSPSPFSPTVYTPPPPAQQQQQAPTTTPHTANSNSSASAPPPPEVLPAPVLRFECGVSMTPRTTTVLDIFGYHSVSSLRVSGPAALDGALVLNASLHRWPFAADLGRSRPTRDDGQKKQQQQQQLRQLQAVQSQAAPFHPAAPSAPAAPFPLLDRGMGLGGGTPGSRVPGDGSTSAAASQTQSQSQPQPSNVTSADSDTSSHSNSSAPTTPNNTTAAPAAAVPVPVAGRDQVLLVSARGGLLPPSSPGHFASIQLGALFEVLPLGYTLDLQYGHANESEDGGGSVGSVGAAGAGPAPPPVQPETQLLLVAFGADYHMQPATHSSSTSSARAACSPHSMGGWLALHIVAAAAFACFLSSF